MKSLVSKQSNPSLISSSVNVLPCFRPSTIRFANFLCHLFTKGAPAQIFSTTFLTSSSSSSGSTIFVSKPLSIASSAPKTLPSNNISRAVDFPTSSMSPAISKCDITRPKRLTGIPKRESELAILRSQTAANSKAPPIHNPLIRTTIGCLQEAIAKTALCISCPYSAALSELHLSVSNSLMSAPGPTALSPSPRKIIHRMLSILFNSVNASPTIDHICLFNALSFSGLFKTTFATWPSISTRTKSFPSIHLSFHFIR